MTTSPKPMGAPFLHSKVFNIIKRICPDSKGLKALDLGCGEGYDSAFLQKHGFSVCAIDLSKQNFKLHKKRNVEFIGSDLNKKFPFKDNFFDVIVATEIIEHLENTRFFLREVYRVLKPNKYVVITTPNVESIFSLTSLLLGSQPVSFRGDYKKVGHITPINRFMLLRSMEEIGFKIDEITYNRNALPVNFIAKRLRPKSEENPAVSLPGCDRLLGEILIILAKK